MRPSLLEVLCCPACQGELRLAAAERDSAGDILAGELTCAACGRAFPIQEGVPRLIPRPEEIASVKRGFEYQWLLRLRGRYERSDTCYGFLTHEFAAWLMGRYATHLAPGQGHWLLDAGCGSAEKTAAVAALRPNDEVVGMDLSDSLASSRKRNAGCRNLHFVQGDVRAPPFKRERFGFIFSIGVLHHAPGTTRDGFEALSHLLTPQGALMTWLYPLPEEDSFWAALYRQRDEHFRGHAHTLPKPLLLMLCHGYVALSFPAMLRVSKNRARDLRAELPFIPRRMDLWEFYKASVFTSFDNLMPEHQRRHGRDEVVGWYRDIGFQRVDARYPGFFCGWRAD